MPPSEEDLIESGDKATPFSSSLARFLGVCSGSRSWVCIVCWYMCSTNHKRNSYHVGHSVRCRSGWPQELGWQQTSAPSWSCSSLKKLQEKLSKNIWVCRFFLVWCQDNRNRSNKESKFDFLATRQCLVKIDEGQQKIKIVHTNRPSNLWASSQSIFSLSWNHPSRI